MVAQVAISLLLLFAAGLFVRTLSNLHAVELGFNRQDLLLFQVDARKAGHKDPEIAAFYTDLRTRFSAIPGVRSASLAQDSLIDAGAWTADRRCPASPPNPANRYLTVGPAFFTTMQIPILAGRDFDERDRRGSPAVAVINEVFARRSFGDRNPLGQRLTLWEPGEPQRVGRDMEIVGVSRNARYGGLTGAIPPVVYMPYDQGYPQPDQMVFALRTSGEPAPVCERRPRNRTSGGRARAGVRGENAGRGHRPDDQPGDHVCPIVHRLRDPGVGDRLRRSLWHRLDNGRPPYRRDRDSHGAGGAASPDCLDGPARGVACWRPWVWRSAWARRWARQIRRARSCTK